MNAGPISIPYRRYALGLLLAVNLLNYIDRQVLFAVFPLIKVDLQLSDTALGVLGSAFMMSYLLLAPLFGWLGDRWSRVKLASGGLVVWSLATSLAGFAPGYRTLLAARATVGVGEASFGTVSPGLISDFFPKERRGQILSWFYVAIPVGSALGYLLGGVLGQRFGWHAAFLMVGLPGLILAVPIALLRTPPRGGDETAPRDSRKKVPGGYAPLFKNRSFVCNTLAMSAMTFAIGGLAQWIPSFLNRVHGLGVASGNTLFGATTVLAGILGTLIGGWLGDRWQKKKRHGVPDDLGVGVAGRNSLCGLGHSGSRLDLLPGGHFRRRVLPLSQHRAAQYRHPQRHSSRGARHGFCRQHLLYPRPGGRLFPLHPGMALGPVGFAQRAADHPLGHGSGGGALLCLRQVRPAGYGSGRERVKGGPGTAAGRRT
ncbi:spinster family MFS transporter [Geomesophilobacter sediminis]|uniref:spinster family MFS transporter n=1 Tax=Geomesophilobacter sediminis TaxID=2798584 RepID=UPI001F2B0B4C|nr:MFS transporter [Geomesophilobacter sediminis]